MYKAAEYFTDNLDNGFAYNVGDVYPREGYTPTEERIQELATADNVRRRPVIAEEAISDSKAIKAAASHDEIASSFIQDVAAVEDQLEEAPEEVKPKRKRKKAE